jgi:hypothetical protein
MSSTDQTVTQAGTANVRCFGISQTGTYDPPGTTGASANAAKADLDPIRVFLIGERAPLEAGVGGWTAGNMIKCDATGKGQAVALVNTTVQWVIAIAEESCAAGEIGYVRVVGPLPYYPAIS